MGDLIGESVNGTPQFWTVYDGSNPYLDFSGSGSLSMHYLANPQGADQLYGRVATGGADPVDWYLTDRQGSVRAIVNQTGGTPSDTINYDAFGNILPSSSIGSDVGRYLFQGGEYDSNLMMYRFGARWEDPSTGRWISQDPLGFNAGDSNLYRYANNEPTSATDPSGYADDFDQVNGKITKLIDQQNKLQKHYEELLNPDNIQELNKKFPGAWQDAFNDTVDQIKKNKKELDGALAELKMLEENKRLEEIGKIIMNSKLPTPQTPPKEPNQQDNQLGQQLPSGTSNGPGTSSAKTLGPDPSPPPPCSQSPSVSGRSKFQIDEDARLNRERELTELAFKILRSLPIWGKPGAPFAPGPPKIPGDLIPRGGRGIPGQ